MAELAIRGGTSVRPQGYPSWPVHDERDVEAVAAVVRGGNWGGFPEPGPNAAALRTIMINAKRYIPMVSPMAMCTPQMEISQIFRVILPQIRNGYPVSRIKMKTPATGNTYLNLMSSSGAITLEGGLINARHRFEPSHHPLPRHFVKPLKK